VWLVVDPARWARDLRKERRVYQLRRMRRSRVSGSTTAEIRSSLKRRYPPRRSRVDCVRRVLGSDRVAPLAPEVLAPISLPPPRNHAATTLWRR
jgi:hypothetical protein